MAAQAANARPGLAAPEAIAQHVGIELLDAVKATAT
jgi:hypothetical protein